jgi:hypothetical protein
MAAAGPTVGDFPSGATMQPRYMGRIMNTYPVSEPEMEHISLLNAQATTLYSIATFLLGVGISIWVNASFYTQLTPEATVATKYVAPFLILFAALCALGGCWSQYKRKGAWEKIKRESSPMSAVATANPVVVASAAPASNAVAAPAS